MSYLNVSKCDYFRVNYLNVTLFMPNSNVWHIAVISIGRAVLHSFDKHTPSRRLRPIWLSRKTEIWRKIHPPSRAPTASDGKIAYSPALGVKRFNGPNLCRSMCPTIFFLKECVRRFIPRKNENISLSTSDEVCCAFRISRSCFGNILSSGGG